MNLTHEGPRATAAVILSFVALAGAFAIPFLFDDPPKEPVGTAAPISTNTDVADDIVLADGSHFGRIVAAYVAPGEVVFDRRDLLVGDEARSAAAADGREAADFFIRDTGLPRAVLPAGDTTIVTRVECGDRGCEQGRRQTYEEFTRSFAEAPETIGDRWFRVLVDDGAVIRLDEQYFP